ncbi:MAG: uridine kinase [Flavobacteriales bacterium]|nr:uridine kinase [Flavobacteriales bacterium]
MSNKSFHSFYVFIDERQELQIVFSIPQFEPYLMYCIGIAGGSASGKTTFISKLNRIFAPTEVCVVSQDHYYKPLSEQPLDENGEINFDRPDGIDFQRLLRDLSKLRSGKAVDIVEYTFNNPGKFPRSIRFHPAPVLIVEGLFIYTHARLNKLFDLKVYIEADPDIMLKRRMTRDTRERGMNREQVIYQWENHVMPAYERFLLPYREHVDMIVLNNTHFEQSLAVMVNHIHRLIEQSGPK